jgi:pSer/pThr/pTyr-binding forkhead associated (FHA) protein
MASLILHKTPNGFVTEDRMQLTPQPLFIGRSPQGSRLVLPRVIVNRQHAKIEFEHGNYVITDLKSRNGTYLNNKSVPADKPTVLKDGDCINICDFLFTFREEPETQGSPPQELSR